MPAPRMPRRDGQRRPGWAALHGLRRLAGWVAVVVAVFTLVTFATVGTSQACPGKNNPSQSAAQSASVPSVVAQSLIYKVARPSTAAPWVIGFGDKPCCGNWPGHCHCPAGAGFCCPACSAGIIIAGWSISREPTPYVAVAHVHASLSSIESDSQFRPPRSTL